jgi:hypothetical protein
MPSSREATTTDEGRVPMDRRGGGADGFLGKFLAAWFFYRWFDSWGPRGCGPAGWLGFGSIRMCPG